MYIYYGIYIIYIIYMYVCLFIYKSKDTASYWKIFWFDIFYSFITVKYLQKFYYLNILYIYVYTHI